MHCILRLTIITNFITRRLRWAGHIARMEYSRNANTVLVRKPEGKRRLKRPRRRWRIILKLI